MWPSPLIFSSGLFHVSHLTFLELERPNDLGHWFSGLASFEITWADLKSNRCLGPTSKDSDLIGLGLRPERQLKAPQAILRGNQG